MLTSDGASVMMGRSGGVVALLRVMRLFLFELCVMIWLICGSLPFYTHVHTCSPSYPDEE